MTRCKVCTHPNREDFERKIATKALSMTEAAEFMHCNKSTVSRHMRNCFPKKVSEWVKPEATKEETLNVIDELIRSYNELVEYCEFGCRLKTPDAIRAVAEKRKHLEFIAKLTGQLL